MTSFNLNYFWSSHCGAAEINPSRNHKVAASICVLAQWVKGPALPWAVCSVGHRCSSDMVLQWLWRRPASTAPIRPLAWECPYAMGAALKRQKDKKKKINITKLEHNFLLGGNGFYCPWTTRRRQRVWGKSCAPWRGYLDVCKDKFSRVSVTEDMGIMLPVGNYLHIHNLCELNLQCVYISYILKKNSH